MFYWKNCPGLGPVTMAPIHLVQTFASQTMFGDIDAKNVTFIIDTSGSMYPYLPAVKDHLNEVLLARAHREKDSMFNVIEFASSVTPWADRMVRCTPPTVKVASEWVNKLSCSDGTNTLDALTVAFSDPVCEAVYLVSDGLPDQQPREIQKQVALVSEGRPIHAIYLTGLHTEVAAQEFLESLAAQTLGTFHVISMTRHGAIERVEAVVTSDHSPLRIQKAMYRKQRETDIPLTTLDNPPIAEETTYSVQGGVPATSIKTTLDNPPQSATITYKTEDIEKPVKYCSVTTSLDHNPVPETVIVRESLAPRTVVQIPAATAWETVRTEPAVNRIISVPPISSVELLEGMKVLARREKDGYYCPGTIRERLSAMRSFLVFFDKDPSGGKCQRLLQETSIYDIKAYNDAMRHPVVPGDKVLAPWEKAGYRFAPGIVLDGIEGRSTGCNADSSNLVVSFFSGKTAKVPKQTAIWIPHSEYERHRIEIQMPLTARHYVVNDPSYERSISGYTVPSTLHEDGAMVGLPVLQKGRVYVPMVMTASEVRDYGRTGGSVRESAVKSEDMHALIPGTGMTRQELNVKVMKQLMDNKMMGSGILKEGGDAHASAKSPKTSTLQKSVSFNDDSFGLDSGISSIKTEQDLEEFKTEEEKLEREVEEMKQKIEESKREISSLIDAGIQTMSLRDTSVGTDSSLLYRKGMRRPKSAKAEVGSRPQWKYWRRMQQPRSTHQELVGPFRDMTLEASKDAKLHSSPQSSYVFEDKDVYAPVNKSSMFTPVDDDHSPVRTDRAQVEWEMRRPRPRTAHVGPFRDTALEAPMEAKLQPAYHEDQGHFNRSAVFTPVNHSQVRSDRAMIEWENKQPRPPPPQAQRQKPGKTVADAVGTRDQIREAKEKSYIEFRRMQTVKREYTWYMKGQQENKMREARDERCRQYAADVTRRDVQRQMDSEAKMEQVQAAKSAVSGTISKRQKELAVQNDSREQKRIDALRARNEKRMDVQRQKDQDLRDAIRHKEEVRLQRQEERSQQHVERLCERREQEAARDLQMRNKELSRRSHFRNIERQNQERKDIRIAMKEQRNEEFRSQVLP
ncbi:uncharacterized protein LOC121405694 isoform X3 [Lytechinus variegatus]|uniref:uncharacterized protein LOC121405694 isoform X3 n=1 Tax=Lytechinus variegatus TaxID=7654 RepID=UPI001BB199F7|nr:uncharacterized protein LOC121405694 isoform X3 [Lytechinus variegatus]